MEGNTNQGQLFPSPGWLTPPASRVSPARLRPGFLLFALLLWYNQDSEQQMRVANSMRSHFSQELQPGSGRLEQPQGRRAA